MTSRSPSIQVVEVNQLETLLSHRDEWSRLLAKTPDASLFHTLDWLAVYWQHFGEEKRLRTLFVYDHDQLIGVLPLMVTNTLTRGGTVRTLGYPLDGWGTHFGPIGENSRTILSAGLSYLRKAVRDWDVLELDWVPDNRRADAAAAFASVRIRPQLFSREDVSLINTAEPWDDYWSNRQGKHRNNIRRAEKKLAALGAVEMLHFRAGEHETSLGEHAAPNPRWDLYDICEQVSKQSWQGSSSVGTTLINERVRAFLRDMHEVAMRLNAVAIHLLSVDREPIAFSYNYIYRGTEFGLRMGFDAGFKHGNPGTVLLHRIVQNAFAGNTLLLDMGEGDSSYKHAWRTHFMPGFRFCHYSMTSIRAQSLRWKRRLCGGSTSANDASTSTAGQLL